MKKRIDISFKDSATLITTEKNEILDKIQSQIEETKTDSQENTFKDGELKIVNVVRNFYSYEEEFLNHSDPNKPNIFKKYGKKNMFNNDDVAIYTLINEDVIEIENLPESIYKEYIELLDSNNIKITTTIMSEELGLSPFLFNQIRKEYRIKGEKTKALTFLVELLSLMLIAEKTVIKSKRDSERIE